MAFALGLIFAATSPAWAEGWGTVYSSYDGDIRSSLYGSNYEVGNAQIKNWSYLEDESNDGNTVYGAMEIKWYEIQIACNCSIWTGWLHRQDSGEISNTTIYWDEYWQENGDAIHAENKSWTCVQLGWPVPDHCSPEAFAQVLNYREG